MVMKTAQKGVTLIEMVLVITIVGLAFAALAGLFATAVFTLPLNERMQSAGQVAQACVERIYAARHTPGFVFTTSTSTLQSTYCSAGSSNTLVLSETTASMASGVCPGSSFSCRQFSVLVTPTAGGGVSSRQDFLLVK